MSNSKEEIESQRQRLTEYLIEEVAAGLSGRNGEEILDGSPSRTLFSGVLQPIRAPATPGTAAAAVAPADTALGIDFRVLARGDHPVRLKITPRWSLYYPVFPTFEQAVSTNQSLFATAPEPEPSPSLASEVSPPGDLPNGISGAAGEDGDLSADNGEDGTADEDGEEEDAAAGLARSGQVVLPKVFRRHDVTLDPILATLDPRAQQPTRVAVGGAELSAAIGQALESIRADSRLWKHLGEPQEAVRDLGESPLLASAATYEQALQGKSGSPVALPAWGVALQVDTSQDPGEPDTLRIQVLLSNTTSGEFEEGVDRLLEEKSLFDARLEIDIDGGELRPFDFLLAPKDYRSNPQMVARGINCTAAYDNEWPSRIRTESLPLFKQPYYRTKEGLEVTFETLDSDDPSAELERIATEMDAYLGSWDEFLANGTPNTWGEAEVEACRRDREEFRKEIEGFRLGMQTLKRDANLAEAFRLMNRAFGMLGKASGGRIRAWRLFQIGFIVSQLPALAVRELDSADTDAYATLLRRELDEVGVLWFPTGGGKTESYLGLIAAALIYDRLRGKVRGVSTWMRFPLRMLSLQQLERLAKVIAVLNELRSEYPRIAAGDPFAIGYYVGDAVTPNSASETKMRELEFNKTARDDLRLLRKCPFCGSGVEIKPIRSTWRVAHVCSNENCFSNKSDSLGPYKGSLPLCIIDNEIYRYLPSVLIGTVDKLAIIARSRFFAHIVGGPQQQCPTHGYTSYDECIERGSWSADCKNKRRAMTAVPRVKDPGPSLLIQDELHLLRAELGVFNGHYEGLLRHLGDRAYMRPKVLAATATIEAYDVHTFHVYLSKSRRYPQSSWQRGESFYATSTPLRHRRFYLGILNHTKAIEDSAVRALTLYLLAVRRLKADPRAAAQIMGRPDATDEAVADTLRLYDLSLCYVNRKATGGSLNDKIPQIDRVLARENLNGIKQRILTGDQPMDYIGATLEMIELERENTGSERLDVVIATNLISHGVDLERINMMTVCGMPSHYAEYVQSTSRAARSHPGIIFVCFKSRDPREHSQYEFFSEMHGHMERLIEAVAVNRFASFAPQKTVPGLLAGLLLCEESPKLFGNKINKTLDHIPTLQVALGFNPSSGTNESGCVDKEVLQATIEAIIGVDKVYPPATAAQIDNVRRRVAEAFEDQMGAIGRTLETKLAEVVKPITSFRDVDEGVDFGSKDASTIVTRLRAK